MLIASDTLGAAQAMLDKAVVYASEREQFGRVIGSFQAVKHMCAEMAAKLEPCRALLWHAAHAIDENDDEAITKLVGIKAATAPMASTTVGRSLPHRMHNRCHKADSKTLVLW